MNYMFSRAYSFNQCLSSWAEKTPTFVKTYRMFYETSCPNEDPSPNPNVGPWCQDTDNGGCCANNPLFEFTSTNKNGKEKVKGNCDFVAKKPKKRCSKTIKGEKVFNECPVTCGLPKCTCIDNKSPFKFKSKGKKMKGRCKNIDPSKYCRITKVINQCP